MKPTLNRLIDVAADLGVGHVVFSSVAGADTNRIVPHHRVETHLRASGLGWTILRPGFFAQNFGDAYRLDITEENRVYVPAGDGRVAFVDVRDLGEVAAAVFQHPEDHAGVGYTLTGPQAVTFTEAAAALTEVVGRTIRYEPATIPGYFGHLRRRSLPVVQAVVQTVLHAGLRRGDAETVDLTVDRLLGRPARPIDVYFRDHADLWT